jgi:glycosyltransferase involved in cell wall biosynthesis
MSESDKRICQITTVHPRYDVRIFHKICMSLVSGYQVFLIVADGKGDEILNGVTIYDAGLRSSSRIKRMFHTSRSAYRKALELDCPVYHFHDPEFLFYGLKLAHKRRKVIYDVHEDVPKQTLSKEYINPFFRQIIAKTIKIAEHFVSSRLYAVVAVTPSITHRFKKYNLRTVNINNYPILLTGDMVEYKNRDGICYVGSISRIRGIKELLSSLEFVDASLKLAGDFESEEFRIELVNDKNWKKVIYYGTVSSSDAAKIVSGSKIGIVTYLPEPNHIDAQPNKMFEYMIAGLPVIASDFPLWREIVMGNECGICVNPKDPVEISEAINYLLKNDVLSEAIGNNGAKAVQEKFNWNSEKLKLFSLYSSLFE